MAFISSVPLTKSSSSVIANSFFTTQSRPTHFKSIRINKSKWSMVTPEPTSTSTPYSSSSTTPNGTSTESYESAIDPEVLVTRAKEVMNDVSDRPGYYSKIAAYLIGGIVVITILKAIVSAIDSLPVLPSTLELIGLGYTSWFCWRYLLFKDSRAELLEEIDDFLGRTRPGGK